MFRIVIRKLSEISIGFQWLVLATLMYLGTFTRYVVWYSLHRGVPPEVQSSGERDFPNSWQRTLYWLCHQTNVIKQNLWWKEVVFVNRPASSDEAFVGTRLYIKVVSYSLVRTVFRSLFDQNLFFSSFLVLDSFLSVDVKVFILFLGINSGRLLFFLWMYYDMICTALNLFPWWSLRTSSVMTSCVKIMWSRSSGGGDT